MSYSCDAHGWRADEKPCPRCDDGDRAVSGKFTRYELIENVAKAILSTIESSVAQDPVIPYVTKMAQRILELCK